MTTIPRNHTRRLADLQARTVKADLHSLDNGFKAEPVDPEVAWDALQRHDSTRVSDQVKLSLDDGLVTLSAGTDRHAMRTKHEPRKSSGGGEALYSIDYLDNFARHLPPCIITLAWDTDMPLAINYKYRGLSAKLLLSPRIEST